MAKQIFTRRERIEIANARVADLVILASCTTSKPKYFPSQERPTYIFSDTNYNPNNNLKCPKGWGEDPTSN